MAQVTGLSAVAMQESNSDVIEVRCSEYSALEVLLNQEVLNFSEQSWMDLKGQTDGWASAPALLLLRSHFSVLPDPCAVKGRTGCTCFQSLLSDQW